FPKAKLRSKLDNKIETVRIGNKAGVPSVPNMLCRLDSYEDLRGKCEKEGLGHDLVLQSAYGDSGHTTFFVSNEKEWNRHAGEIVGQG
ncbi:biotin carboxylase, partial [Enterococcus hirae]